MIRRLINIQSLTKAINYRFAAGLFPKSQKKIEKTQHLDTQKDPKKPLFTKYQAEKSNQSDSNAESDGTKSRFTSTQTLDYLVNKINEVNNYYLGVRHNTKYLKVNRLIKYQQAAQLKANSFSINDFPIEISKGERSQQKAESFQNCDQNVALTKKSGQIAFSHCRLEPVLLKIQQLVHQYYLSLASDKRFKGLEPNFELQNIKIRNAFKDSIKLTLKNEEAKPEIKIKDITLFKGLGVIRNDNYSTDSYSKDQSQSGDGIVSYTLYRQKKERYPEREWLSTKYINARFEVLVKGGPAIQVKENGRLLGSTENLLHNVVVQADLIPPPTISESQLTPQQYLRSYRLVANKLVITNFDRKNQFFSLTFSEAEKKDVLYNGFQ